MTAATRIFRRMLSRRSSEAAAMVKGVSGVELKAIKVDNSGRAWRIGVRIGKGEGLLGNLHPRDAPLLERTGSFGDTPATLTSRPGMLIVRFQPFSAVIGGNCALLMDANRASPKAAAGAIAASVSQHTLSTHDVDGDHENDPNDPRGVGGGGVAPLRADTLAVASAHAEEDAEAHARIQSAIAVDDFPLRALECILDEATAGRDEAPSITSAL